MKASQNTENYEKKALTLKGFPLFAHWCSSQKQKTYSFAQVALAIEKPISVFREKFNLEFTRQPVNFSIEFNYSSVHVHAFTCSSESSMHVHHL